MQAFQFLRAAAPAVMVLLVPAGAYAASCCGGGSSSTLVLSKNAHLMADLSGSWERYDGYWRSNGAWTGDPPGSDLNQYRLTAGAAYRLGDNWQAAVTVPYVWNRNRYTGLDSHTDDWGDSQVALTYESFDQPMCVYDFQSWADLKPAIYWTAALTVPTGVSPYDDVPDNFAITGRGFYRLDGSVLIEKTIYPWTATLGFGYGRHMERPVNREYGTYVAPYDKRLGDRVSWSATGGYVYTTDALQEITTTLGYTDLQEGDAEINGVDDNLTGFRKRSVTLGLAWSSPTKDWIVKLSWNHAVQRDGWGYNFPTTDSYTLGLSHVID